MHTDLASADDMIGDLGALLRMSLESESAHEVSLFEEINALELYLNIQRLRFQDTLTISLRIDPGTLDAKVPHLILQPIVENAFRHGISKVVGHGELRIESSGGPASLKLSVADNGPGARGCAIDAGIGLSNTRARLSKLYGVKATLNLHDSSPGFLVELHLPFRETDGHGA
jgi:LytS/YehU family sensor histidine kinase